MGLGRRSFTRSDARGNPNVKRWNALSKRRDRMVRRRGLFVWLHFRYKFLPHYVHRRVWVASWGLLSLLWLRWFWGTDPNGGRFCWRQ